MAYCLYLRKSRADMEAEAHGEGETLARHEQLLLELAKKRKFHVTQIYREIVSGETIAARPVMQRLLQEVEAGLWEGVLVVEVERLARGETIDQGVMAQAFKYSNTKIITPLKDYDPTNEFDEEYFEFGLFMSRREYKAINRRLIRGREAASREGKWVGGSPPYGYERVRVENGKGWTLAVNEDEADIVRLIFKLYTEGETLPNGSVRDVGPKPICGILEKMNVPTPSGGRQWSNRTIEVILQNPVYIGKIRWSRRKTKRSRQNDTVVKERYVSPEDEWIVVDGLHEPIVSTEVFEKAAEKLSRRGPAPVALFGELKNPFSGIAVCAKCGRTLSLRTHPTHPMLKCPNRFCDNVGTGTVIFEQRVLEALSGWLDEYRLEWTDDTAPSDAAAISVAEKTLRKSETDLETLEKQLARTHDLLEQGIYDTDTFLERSRVLTEKIESAKKSSAELSSALSEAKLRAANRKNIVPKVEKLLEVYAELPSAQAKNDLLKEVLEKITYQRDKPGTKKGPFDNFEIVLFPKLPGK